jgi:hypothetical protein
MYHHNPTEVWRERQLTLLREAEHRRLVRLARKGGTRASSDAGERRMAKLGRAISLWGRTVVSFFLTTSHEHGEEQAR